jgi:hypothetical protein
MHAGEEEGLSKADCTHSERSPVGQLRSVVSFTVPVMEEGGRALISHISMRKGHGALKVMHILLLFCGGCGLEHTVSP